MQDEILSRLPIRDAARTSALSRAWRRRWEPVPYRLLDWPLGTPADTVDGVLAHCAHPVREFRHPRIPEPDFGRSDHWLRRLAAVGVRSVSVQFCFTPASSHALPPHIHMLHPCIFSCGELATLDLVGCAIPAPPPPSSVGFPSLTTLSLSKVGFPQGVGGLESLISSSPSLQRCSSRDCMHIPAVEFSRRGAVYEQWVINAPNLQRLRIVSEYDCRWHFSGLPFLEGAEMSGLYSGFYADGRDFLNLVSGLDQARELKLRMPYTWNDALDGLSPSFENLKSLSLHTQVRGSSILNILCVVRNAPKLEVLEIEFTGYRKKFAKEVGIDFLHAQCADGLFSTLTNVRMKGAICGRYDMLFIELVLSKARQLEAFDVCLSRKCSRPVEDALAEVARYGRASPGANVIIRDRQHVP